MSLSWIYRVLTQARELLHQGFAQDDKSFWKITPNLFTQNRYAAESNTRNLSNSWARYGLFTVPRLNSHCTHGQTFAMITVFILLILTFAKLAATIPPPPWGRQNSTKRLQPNRLTTSLQRIAESKHRPAMIFGSSSPTRPWRCFFYGTVGVPAGPYEFIVSGNRRESISCSNLVPDHELHLQLDGSGL